MSKNPPGSVGGVISNSIAIYKRGWLFQMSKVVSPHLWNTPRATFTNRRFSGIPFIIGERGDCLGWCSRVCCIFVENGVFFFPSRRNCSNSRCHIGKVCFQFLVLFLPPGESSVCLFLFWQIFCSWQFWFSMGNHSNIFFWVGSRQFLWNDVVRANVYTS